MKLRLWTNWVLMGLLVSACGQISVQFGTVKEDAARRREPPRFDPQPPTESVITPFRLRLMDRHFVFQSLKQNFSVEGDSSTAARGFLSLLEDQVLSQISSLGGPCDPFGVRPPNASYTTEGLAPPTTPISNELSQQAGCGIESARSQLPAIAVGGPARTATLESACNLVVTNSYSMLSFVRKVWTSPTPAPVSLSALNRAPNDEELLQIHERFFGSRPLGSHGILESLRSLADQSFSRFDAITSWQMPVLAICQSEDWTVP